MRLLLTLTLALAVASSASAQGSIGIYFDEAGTQSSATVNTFAAFDFYVVLKDVDSGVSGVEYHVSAPPTIAIAPQGYGGPNPIAVGNDNTGYALGLGGCELLLDVTGNTTFVVESFTGFAVVDLTDASIDLGPYTGTGWDPGITSPRFADCSDSIFNVTSSPGTVNSVTVSNDADSWGHVKALYAN